MKKKPILICLYAYYPFENANTNVMFPLIKELSKIYEVHILTENRDNTALKYEIDENNIIVHRYSKNSFFKMIVNMIGDIDRKKKRVWYKSLLIQITTPIARILQKFIKKNEFIELEKLTRNVDYNFVITTCESFDSHRNMLRLKKESRVAPPWIAYFMDPFANYIENRDTKGELLETEQEVYEKADMILVTEEIYKENHKNIFSSYLFKTFPFRFGNFRSFNHELVNDIFVPNKINCVYVGSLLNEKIRNPEYFYKILNCLDDRFYFHIICNRVSEKNKHLYESVVKNKSKVSWYYDLPLAECLGIMCHADILINLGNKSINQTPSKVFDYIGTGKPIINFYSLANDTSKYYLENYPNKLNIFEDIDCINENASAFTTFAEKCAGGVVSQELLKCIYSEYDSQKVTQTTIQLINNFALIRSRVNNVQD